MQQEVEFFPLHAQLGNQYLLVDEVTQTIDISQIDPTQWPVLYPYTIDHLTERYCVLGHVSYRQAYFMDGLIHPDVAQIPTVIVRTDLHNMKMITLPIASSGTEFSALWLDVEPFLENAAIPVNLNQPAVTSILAVYHPKRVLEAIERYLTENVLIFGHNGIVNFCQYNLIPLDLVPVDREDYMRLLRSYNTLEVDMNVFRVDAIDVFSLPHVPLKGVSGKCHLNYVEMVQYILCYCRKAFEAAVTNYYVAKYAGALPDQLVRLEYVDDTAPNSKYKRIRMHTPKNVAYNDGEMVDIEDLDLLYKQTAPCVKRMLNTGDFPTNHVRIKFVWILRQGGIGFSTVNTLFEHFFNATNSRGHSSLKDRFDPTYQYEKGYNSPGCKQMQEYCPFAGNNVYEKRRQCFARLQGEFPDKITQQDFHKFYWPYKWYQLSNKK